MGQSTVVEWLNENSNRAYPLLSDTSTEVSGNGGVTINVQNIILDANIVYTEDDLPDVVKLESISSNGNDLTFRISGESSEVFLLENALTATYPNYIRNSQGSLLVLGEEAKACVIAANPSLELTDVIFEPSVVSECRGRLRGVTSLSFSGSTLVGLVELVEGYQTGIEFKVGNTLYISASPSEGLPLDCRNFFQNELVYDCGVAVSWVNGATAAENGGRLKLTAGRNIRIFEDKENSKIYIGLDFEPEDICVLPSIPPK